MTKALSVGTSRESGRSPLRCSLRRQGSNLCNRRPTTSSEEKEGAAFSSPE